MRVKGCQANFLALSGGRKPTLDASRHMKRVSSGLMWLPQESIRKILVWHARASHAVRCSCKLDILPNGPLPAGWAYVVDNVLYVCMLYVCMLYVCIFHVCMWYVCMWYVCMLCECSSEWAYALDSVLYVRIAYVCMHEWVSSGQELGDGSSILC